MKRSGVLFWLIVLFSVRASGDQFAVVNTNDSGVGSLRQAIADANSHAGPDTIVFHLDPGIPGHDAGSGTWTIALSSTLLMSGDDCLVDGWSQA
ncbi:MAG TPA: hypothetical protein ENN03_01570 [bacterium]|nr:hypothetical protein [bacterium]